jgi:hypothetical protein
VPQSASPSRKLASGFGFAFGRSFTRKVAAMIELRTESSIDRLVLVNARIIDGVATSSGTRTSAIRCSPTT